MEFYGLPLLLLLVAALGWTVFLVFVTPDDGPSLLFDADYKSLLTSVEGSSPVVKVDELGMARGAATTRHCK